MTDKPPTPESRMPITLQSLPLKTLSGNDKKSPVIMTGLLKNKIDDLP